MSNIRIPFKLVSPQFGFHRVLDRVFASKNFILGNEVDEFEKEYAEYVGAKYCIAVGNGFDALRISLSASGIGEGDEVLVPSNAPLPTWMAVTSLGANVRPVEPDPETALVDAYAFIDAITSFTKAIIPVHLYGNPVIPPQVEDRIIVIEDCCQAHGARISNRMVGSFGKAAAWSFYPTKNLHCFGDGGAITTNDPDFAAIARKMRFYGSGEYVGQNSRLDELQAAFLREELKTLDRDNMVRSSLAKIYDEQLMGVPGVTLLEMTQNSVSVYHQYVIKHPKRNKLREYLSKNYVPTMIHYPYPPNTMPIYSWIIDEQPIAEQLSKEVVSLPLYPELTPETIVYICNQIKRFEQ